MATGNTMQSLFPQMNAPPSSGYATRDTRNVTPVLDFDDTSVEAAIFVQRLPRNYAGGGLTVSIEWRATSATAGNVVWGASFERHQALGDDHDSDSFAAEVTAVSAAPGTSGQSQYVDIAFTDGAQIDSLAVGEGYRLKLRRVATDASDDMIGDAEFVSAEVRET